MRLSQLTLCIFFAETFFRVLITLKSAFIYSEAFAQYDFGPLHPFKTARAKIVYELCHRYNLLDRPWIEIIKPEPLCFEKLTLFHDSEYLRLLEAASSKAFDFEMLGCGLGTEENPVFEGLYNLLTLSAGATYKGVELLVGKDLTMQSWSISPRMEK